MKIISHRANLNGPDPTRENLETSIETCIDLNFDVEIDIWLFDNQFFLGHDNPICPVSKHYLIDRKNFLWVHCKNLKSLSKCLDLDLHCFYHDKDDFVLTSKNFIWAYPGNAIDDKTIQVLPEWCDFKVFNENCQGVCRDYPIKIKKIIDNQ